MAHISTWGKVSHKEDMEQSGTRHTCWNCGATTTAGQRFCPHCGSSLDNQQLQQQHSATIPLLNDITLLTEHKPASSGATGPAAAGTILGWRYRVVRIVGKGGFGTIYEAQDTRFQSGRVVAVKEMSDT